MTIGEALTLVQWTPVLPEDFSIFRQSKSTSDYLSYEDLIAEDWIVRVGVQTFCSFEDAQKHLIVRESGVKMLSSDANHKLEDSCRVDGFPAGITARGAEVVCSRILEAIPVLSSFVFSDDFQFKLQENK